MTTKQLTLLFIGLFCSSFLLINCGGKSEGGVDSLDETTEEATIPINEAFKILAHENDLTRMLYTKSIVGPGKKNGLKFDEEWAKDDIEAGPLPALFLRLTAGEIRKTDYPLGLYLGSDFNIGKGNEFTGVQAEKFAEMRKDTQPKFFYDAENEEYIAMFADIASAGPCVTCHNEHPKTPKDDWELNDIMGATTWSYPKEKITYDELLGLVAAYQSSAKSSYEMFLTECKNFKESEVPTIGDKWFDGYNVPSADRFLDSVDVILKADRDAALAKLK